MKIATFNVMGLKKLDYLLQYMASENIDVLSCIDAQLSAKSVKVYGKIAKNTLGAGTVTHCAPRLSHFGRESGTKYRKVGDIFMIIGPKWGSSHTKFAMDMLGPGGSTAGVLARTTVGTTDGDITIIASY